MQDGQSFGYFNMYLIIYGQFFLFVQPYYFWIFFVCFWACPSTQTCCLGHLRTCVRYSMYTRPSQVWKWQIPVPLWSYEHLIYEQRNTYASVVVLKWIVVDADVEEKNCWIVIIFYFFKHDKYSRSFVKLCLNHYCHMAYFNDALTMFLGLGTLSVQGQKALGFHQ